MITHDEALKFTQDFVALLVPDHNDDEYIVVEEATRDLGFGWLFFYDSKKFRETDELRYAIAGNGPLFVLKSSGHVEELSSHQPVGEWITELNAKYQGNDCES